MEVSSKAVQVWSAGKLLDELCQKTGEQKDVGIQPPSVDDVLHGYIHDFVHTVYNPSTVEEEEVGIFTLKFHHYSTFIVITLQ